MKMLHKSQFLGKQQKGQWELMVHHVDAQRYYAEAWLASHREHREHSGDARKENLGMNCHRPGGGALCPSARKWGSTVTCGFAGVKGGAMGGSLGTSMACASLKRFDVIGIHLIVVSFHHYSYDVSKRLQHEGVLTIAAAQTSSHGFVRSRCLFITR